MWYGLEKLKVSLFYDILLLREISVVRKHRLSTLTSHAIFQPKPRVGPQMRHDMLHVFHPNMVWHGYGPEKKGMNKMKIDEDDDEDQDDDDDDENYDDDDDDDDDDENYDDNI